MAIFTFSVMASASLGKEAYVFPCNSWVGAHVVDLGTQVSSPVCFSDEHFVFDIFVEAPELDVQGINNGGGEISGGAKSMEYLVTFFDRWSKFVSIEVEPVVTW